ncbi:MAG: DUF3820 family protein [Bdellovibrionales bacterium]
MDLDGNHLLKMATTKMPYGKFKGMRLIDLPEPYVVWIYTNAKPKGQLGDYISEIYEIKLNGIEGMVKKLL